MTPNKVYSQRTPHHAFILWGDRFEEEVTTIFATELRRAGVSVKIVGLAGLKAPGVHGLVLSCDITLWDALPLAHQAVCIILPCSVATIKRIENDPRVHEFFKLALQNQAQFVIQHSEVITYLRSQGLAIFPTAFSIYTNGPDLIHFAHEIALRLATNFSDL